MASKLELAIKEHPIIIHYEISIDLSHIKTFSNELDGRNRWVTFSNQIKTFTTSSRFGSFYKTVDFLSYKMSVVLLMLIKLHTR